MILNKTNIFIEKAILIHGTKYDYSLVEYIKATEKIKIICPDHGEFLQSPNSHLSNHGCGKCSNNIKSNSFDFIKKAKIIHNDNYNYSLVEYNGNKKLINILCKKHGTFKQRPSDHLNGQGCPLCFGNKNLSTIEFINKSKIIHGDLYNYEFSEYINQSTKIKIICPNHGLFYQYPTNHLSGKKCELCSINDKIKTNGAYIIEANIIHNNKYDYSLTDYKHSRRKIKIICPTHGIFNQVSGNHLSGQGCPICKESKGELAIRNFLLENNIKFIQEYKFSDCKHTKELPFDFYLPDYNLCIEFNGKQHYMFSYFYHRNEQGFILQQKRDKIKRDYCELNNINLIIIKYNENILTKLNHNIRIKNNQNAL